MGSDEQELLEQLRKLSLKDKAQRQGSSQPALGMASQYQLNYRPMPKGTRLRLWEEGWKYRILRRKSGFKHTKLEWKTPSMRGRNSAGSTSVDGSNKSDLESLQLPPTKLEKKRLRLQRMYQKELARKIPRPHTSHHNRPQGDEAGEAPSVDVDLPNPPKARGSSATLRSYDRNRLNNLKSHIVMPTCPSSVSSRMGSATNLVARKNDRKNSSQYLGSSSPSGNDRRPGSKASASDTPKEDSPKVNRPKTAESQAKNKGTPKKKPTQ